MIAAALGIVSGAVMGRVLVLGAIAELTARARGCVRHGALVFVLGPPSVSMGNGYVPTSPFVSEWAVQPPETARSSGSIRWREWPGDQGAAIVSR